MIRAIEPRTRIVLMILMSVAVACLVPDPYTYGGVGGDRHNFDVHTWQMLATGTLVLLLVLGASRKGRHTALKLFLVESLLFVILNLIYVGRDGFNTRTVVGNYGFRLPAFLILSGLAVRVALMLVVRGFGHSSSMSRPTRVAD